MRGQRLFIRPLEADDRAAIDSFFVAESWAGPPPTHGLLAKLVGDVAAVLGMELEPGAIVVQQLVVRRELRRKRIARALLGELESLAANLDRDRILVRDAPGLDDFLRRVGFEWMDGTWVRRVRRQ